MKFQDLKLKYKISIVMTILLILISITTASLQILMFREEYEHKSYIMAQEWARIGEQRLEQMYKPIEKEVINSVVDYDFKSTMYELTENLMDTLKARLILQKYFTLINKTSTAINHSYILVNNGMIISQFQDYTNIESPLLDYEVLRQFPGFNVLKSVSNPFNPDNEVIPLVYSFCKYRKSNYTIMSTSTTPDFIFVILLDTHKVENLFENKESEFEYKVQLNNGNSNIFKEDERIWKDSINIDMQTSLPGITMKVTIDKDTFMPMKKIILKYSIIITSILSIIGIFAIFAISRHLTSPFKKITRMLARIKYNTYEFDEQAKYKDETGLLISGINDMYRTILENMEKIKATEKEKFKYLSQLLTEQINPHFIYNTLEMINMEIQTGNTQSASKMINYFATYLRTTLNNGQDMTSIKTQLSNVNAYYNIMNARINGTIMLTINSAPELDNVYIPKSTMQPIVENAIKHGFEYARNIEMFIMPEIKIDISGTKEEIVISISDNGKGFDVENTAKLMKDTSVKQHMGISNVYRRLKIYDNQSDIEMSSVPFFMNEFRIIFHPKKEISSR